MINCCPACVHMELDQQCTDIGSKAGFLWQPLDKKSCLYLSLGFSPVLPLFNFSSSPSSIYAYPSYHWPGSISFLQSLYSTLLGLTFFTFFTYHTSDILSFPSPLYLPTSSTLLSSPSLTPLTHSSHHPPDAVSHPLLLIPPMLHPAIYIGMAAPLFLGLSSSAFCGFFAWRSLGSGVWRCLEVASTWFFVGGGGYCEFSRHWEERAPCFFFSVV